MKSLFPLVLALGGTIAIGACKHTERELPTRPLELDVLAIDGTLENAQVWLDRNNNFICDLDEPSTISDKFGKASLNIREYSGHNESPIVVMVIAGQTTNQHFPDKVINHSYLMSAPAGHTKISPFSTLVHLQTINQSSQILSRN